MSCISSTPIPMKFIYYMSCGEIYYNYLPEQHTTQFLTSCIYPSHLPSSYISDYELGNKKKENRKWHYIHTQSNLKMYRCSRFFITFEDNKRQPCIDGIKLYMPNTISLSRHLQYITEIQKTLENIQAQNLGNYIFSIYFRN